MTDTHITAQLRVIIEILSFQQTVLVAYKSISLHIGWIKLHLYFHVFGYGKQGTTKLGDHGFARFGDVVDIGIVSMAFIGQ